MPPRDDLFRHAARLAAPYRLVPPAARAAGRAGAFVGRRDGQSLDFHDYRRYQPGDDLRRVDWRAYARSGQMHLRLFREEVSPTVEIHLDASASMGAYPGKADAALFAAAFLAEAVAAAEGQPILCLAGARHAGGDIRPALAGCRFDAPEPFRPAAVPPTGLPLRILLSDFLWEHGAAAPFERSAQGSLGLLPLMIVSNSEADPPWRGPYRLHDVEHPDAMLDLTLDDAAVRAYRSRLRQHRDQVAATARRHGGKLVWWQAPDDPCMPEDLAALAAHLGREGMVTLR